MPGTSSGRMKNGGGEGALLLGLIDIRYDEISDVALTILICPLSYVKIQSLIGSLR